MQECQILPMTLGHFVYAARLTKNVLIDVLIIILGEKLRIKSVDIFGRTLFLQAGAGIFGRLKKRPKAKMLMCGFIFTTAMPANISIKF